MVAIKKQPKVEEARRGFEVELVVALMAKEAMPTKASKAKCAAAEADASRRLWMELLEAVVVETEAEWGRVQASMEAQLALVEALTTKGAEEVAKVECEMLRFSQS
ncbi:hypothetical protein ACLOJK_006293 [Asimina triloba]